MSITDLSANALLASLPAAALYDIKLQAAVVDLEQGSILCQNEAEVDEVYFPLSGFISLVFLMKTGKSIETATIGREGSFGAMAGLGIYTSYVKAIVPVSSVAARVTAPTFRKLAAKHKTISDLAIRYNEVLLDQARVNAACNALHRIESRLSRWLLQGSDRASSSVITLTQDSIAQLLGARRTSVTEAAGNLQDAGIIKYSRGTIIILDRKKMEGVACECYQTLLTRASISSQIT